MPGPGEFELIERYFGRAARARGTAISEAGGAAAQGASAADARRAPSEAERHGASTGDVRSARPDVPCTSGVVLGIGDDAALLTLPEGTELAVSVDTLVAGRHFPEDTDPRSIGHRALAVNLSDLAAMGATPAWVTLALTLPNADHAWLEGFSSGFLDLAAAEAVELVGGDTTRGPLTMSVQIMGHVARGTALRRAGARSGDLIAVTGTLGDAGAGLALRQGRLSAPRSAAEQLLRRFDFPEARVAFGREARGLAAAAMDLSDGLAGDLAKLAAASSVAAHVEVERLPLSQALRASVDPGQALEWALSAGDDYEILLTVPPAHFAALAARAARLNLMLTHIGRIERGTGVSWSRNGRAYQPASSGYDHFA